MKILLLGDGGSAHIQKWVGALASKGIETGLFSLHHFDESSYKNFPNVTVLNNPSKKDASSLLSKIGYLTNTKLLKSKIAHFKPTIVHAHYASSYGLLGSSVDFKPFVVSAWGSDVYDFPKTSLLHKKIIKKVLSKADIICSTSNCMKEETKKYTKKEIVVIPFGIDINIFKPIERSPAKNEITIGIIKSLEENYGIDLLIKAFHEVAKKYSDKKLKLLLVGDGSKRKAYEKLCGELNISDKVEFTGKVPHSEVAAYHHRIDIFVSLSLKESFGVSLVEAMASGTPVVVSATEGFVEVIGDERCGSIVPTKNFMEAAKAIDSYIKDPLLANEKAKSARARVLEYYDWNGNVDQMISVYRELL